MLSFLNLAEEAFHDFLTTDGTALDFLVDCVEARCLRQSLCLHAVRESRQLFDSTFDDEPFSSTFFTSSATSS